MSIRHSYAVDCDAGGLLFDRVYTQSPDFGSAQIAVEAGRADRRAQQIGCKLIGPESYTSAEARKQAAAQGWIRHGEAHPRFPGEGGRKQRKTYDLCPVCAPKLVQP